MSFSLFKVLRGLLIKQEGTLTPTAVQILPGGTASTTTTIQAGQTVDRTLTLPDATDTLVGKATTDTLTNKSISGSTNTVTNLTDSAIAAGANIDAAKIGTSVVSTTEFNYLDGVTSPIQTQLNTKLPASGGTLTNATIDNTNTITVKDANLTIQDDGDATKQLKLELSGITTATTRTLTVPNANTTLVGTDTTQSLTNKTLDNTTTLTIKDTNFTLQDDSDNSKQVNFELSSVTTGTTRILTVPNFNTTLVGTNVTQTLTNKTVDVLGFTDQSSTPASPSAGTHKVYVKTDGNPYILDSTGVEQPLGSGGASGSKNYLGTVNGTNLNGNFELGSTSGWSLFNTTLTSGVPTGSITAGAASVTTFTATTSGKLAGNYSLQTSTTGAWTAGQGFISNARTIDIEDQSKVITVKLYYSVTSGASNLNVSGTSSNTLAVYAYDVTNSTWIPLDNLYGMNQSTGVGFLTGTFQTSVSGTQYRLAVVAANASAGAATILWDDFFLGPQTAQVGQTLAIAAQGLLTGTQTITSNTLTKIAFAASDIDTVSGFDFVNNRYVVKVPGVYEVILKIAAATNVTSAQARIYKNGGEVSANQINNGTALNLGTTTNYITSANAGDYFEGFATLIGTTPGLTGADWTTMTIRSITGPSVIAASTSVNCMVYNNNGQSIPNTAAFTTIVHNAKMFDSHSAYNTSTGTYTAPVSGKYRVSANCWYSSTAWVAGNATQISIIVNGSVRYFLDTRPAVATGTYEINPAGGTTITLNSGDTLVVQTLNNRTAGAATLGTSDRLSNFSIDRVGN